MKIRVWNGAELVSDGPGDVVDLVSDELGGLCFRINFRVGQIQVIDGGVVDKSSFTMEQLFALVRYGIPSVDAMEEADEPDIDRGRN
jgi:hypothetical protein